MQKKGQNINSCFFCKLKYGNMQISNTPVNAQLIWKTTTHCLENLRGVIRTIVWIPIWQPLAYHFHHFNMQIFPSQNPVKNGKISTILKDPHGAKVVEFTIYVPLTPKMHQTKFVKNWPMACSFQDVNNVQLLTHAAWWRTTTEEKQLQ